MGFERFWFLIGSGLLIGIYLFYRTRLYRGFFARVKDYWFFKPTLSKKLSIVLYIIAFCILAIGLGDLRGKEEIIEGNIPTQKTLVLIDTSASMLVEDIRPNRIKKAVLLARHFIRNSYGHQVSLGVFSDIFKQIVPFTDDIEILEARLQTVNDAQPEGGSNIKFALREAIQYFQSKSGYVKGNILLITDGEEHESIDLNIPSEISLAVIGIGSENGGKIPLRRDSGQFIRYKKNNNIEVISKISKTFFENLAKTGEHIKVWYAQSYSMPTNEVLAFFAKIHEESFTKGSMRQRPVMGIPIIITFVALYCLYVIFSRFKTFSTACIIFIVLSGANVKAQDDDGREIPPEVQQKMSTLLDKFKEGAISKNEKLELAELFSSIDDNTKANSLYRGAMKDLDEEKVEDVFNFGTSLLKEKKFSDGIELYKYLDKEREIPDEMREIVRKNIQLAMQSQKNDSNQSQDSKDKKDQKDQGKDKKKDNKKDKQNKNSKGQNSGNNQSQDQKDDGDDKNNKPKDREENKEKEEEKDKEKEKQDKDGKDGKDDKESEKKKKPDSWEQVQKDAELKKKKESVKGVLKQIMNDDGNLQKKFINSKTNQNSREAKDW
ncbi:VWA domain-containing protein [Bacteriovorax sp. Seq25_V]|uniref:vWA domain-containing protein n=1 Tax=Bacteriovorax sp. Seq25_V TaxID=1201288 RepID=UPI00038A41D9|nr:VWA domain-containing protein [Bacteriovorax sp. Seq25_V]EQC43206.1 von Willebrand factor type A domain protein [Bacteriovorax sp. Seq25_V]